KRHQGPRCRNGRPRPHRRCVPSGLELHNQTPPVRRIVAVIVMGVLKSRLGRTDAFAACFRAGRSWRIPDRRRTELERHEWIDSNRLAADRVVYQASESDHRAGEEMNWVGYPRRRDGPCARQPAVRNPYRMREKMSRSGAPPQAEVTKSLWSTEPAST